MSQPPLVVILGPTAVGKTDLSLWLAEHFQGEIVNADSRQIYRGMDIGTAKPSVAEQNRVPHHLLDIRQPDESLTLADYQALAYEAIEQIQQRGRVPFLVGGSALYLRGVVRGLRIPHVPPNPALRAELEAFAAAQGAAALFARLQHLDPRTADRTDPLNVRRVVRALEIVLESGQSKVDLEGEDPPPYRILQIGLDRERAELYARTDERVQEMAVGGLLAETQTLLQAGYAMTLPAMTSLGYREMVAHLRGELTLEEAVDRIQIETHRFVRHQYSWFRRMQDVHWFHLGVGQDLAHQAQIHRLIQEFLSQKS